MSRKTQANLKVVFDTNIFIMAAIRPDSLAAKLLFLTTQKEFCLYISNDIIAELNSNLKNNKIKKQKEFLELIKENSAIVKINKKSELILRDKKDQIILDCALNSKANIIVTNDRDLTSIKTYKNIAIVHLSTFKRYFGKNGLK